MGTRKYTHVEYTDQIKHTNIKPLEPYDGVHTKILHQCMICDYIWSVIPRDIRRGHGCHKCSGCPRMTHDEYVNKIKQLPITILDEYVALQTKVRHQCDICSTIWKPRPLNIMNGTGCPKCNRGGHSKIAIKWLYSFNNTNIQHAERLGEYRIPSTRMHVDGYDSETNTVYEFLGDRFHGNLDVFLPDEHCNPFSDKSTKELNDEWIDRKNTLESLNYNVVFIWELDYREELRHGQ